MSIDATQAVWKLSKDIVTPIQKLILLSLADRAGENAECWPSVRRLVQDTGLDRHTICRNKQTLIEKKLIEYTGQKRGRTKSVDVIRLLFVHPREGYESSAYNNTTIARASSVHMPTASNSSSAQMPTTKQCTNAHCESKRIEPKKNNGDLQSPMNELSLKTTEDETYETDVSLMNTETPCSLHNHNKPDYSNNRSVNCSVKQKKEHLAYKKYSEDSDFMRFYQVYRKKEKPQHAYTEFKKLNVTEELLTILVKDVTKRFQNTEHKYIPNPDRYLREKYWESRPLQSTIKNTQSQQANTQQLKLNDLLNSYRAFKKRIDAGIQIALDVFIKDKEEQKLAAKLYDDFMSRKKKVTGGDINQKKGGYFSTYEVIKEKMNLGSTSFAIV